MGIEITSYDDIFDAFRLAAATAATNYWYTSVASVDSFIHTDSKSIQESKPNNEERIKVVSRDPDNLLVSWIVS
jgi:hypothetical protein